MATGKSRMRLDVVRSRSQLKDFDSKCRFASETERETEIASFCDAYARAMVLTEEERREYERLALVLRGSDLSDEEVAGFSGFLEDLVEDGIAWHTTGERFELTGDDFITGGWIHRADERADGPCARAVRESFDSLKCLRFAHENGAPWDEFTCALAAWAGDLECLRYAREHGCPWDGYTCEDAALSGSLECLKYAHEHGCPWSENITECGGTCGRAALSGELECLKYAHEQGCPWDERTCMNAASKCLECLKYAHEQGCPWDEWTCEDAAFWRNPECLEYAHENGCPGGQLYIDAWNAVDLPDADTAFGLEVGLNFQRNGHISAREFLETYLLWKRTYREARVEASARLAREIRHVRSRETRTRET